MIGFVITPEYIATEWGWDAILLTAAWLMSTGARDITIAHQGNEEYVCVGDDVICYHEVDDEEA